MTLRFESDPPGAEVWREGADIPVGTTPVEHSFIRTDQDATFHFRLRGYQDAEHVLSLNGDGVGAVSLLPVRAARPRTMAATMDDDMSVAATTMGATTMDATSAMDAMSARRNTTNGRRAVLEF